MEQVMKNRNFAFFTMLFLLSLLCIFLYFGGNEMKCCEKIIISIFIGVIAVLAIICVWFSNDKKESLCQETLYVDDAGLFVLCSGKRNPKICHIQYYESVEELKKCSSKLSKIYIKPNVEIDSKLIDYLKNNGYEFSILNSDTTVIIKNKTTNASDAEENNQIQER